MQEMNRGGVECTSAEGPNACGIGVDGAEGTIMPEVSGRWIEERPDRVGSRVVVFGCVAGECAGRELQANGAFHGVLPFVGLAVRRPLCVSYLPRLDLAEADFFPF